MAEAGRPSREEVDLSVVDYNEDTGETDIIGGDEYLRRMERREQEAAERQALRDEEKFRPQSECKLNGVDCADLPESLSSIRGVLGHAFRAAIGSGALPGAARLDNVQIDTPTADARERLTSFAGNGGAPAAATGLQGGVGFSFKMEY